MNPKSGSFNINLRLQRWFTIISCLNPTKDIVVTIFKSILDQHLLQFDDKTQKISEKMLGATFSIFNGILKNAQFSPSAKKFF